MSNSKFIQKISNASWVLAVTSYYLSKCVAVAPRLMAARSVETNPTEGGIQEVVHVGVPVAFRSETTLGNFSETIDKV